MVKLKKFVQSYEEIERILKRKYDVDLNSIFSYIDEVPLGLASILQVHRAISVMEYIPLKSISLEERVLKL